ncbi:MAG: hypothetical protein P4L59_06250 [Desulfosporosinus sp.]|nr:hypothetical protein [Desulfosporosinus sp.]
MTILLIIIAIPFIIVLSITVAFLYFIFCVSEWICTIAAVLLSALEALTFITGGSTFSGVVLFPSRPPGCDRVVYRQAGRPELYPERLYDGLKI